MLFCFVQVTSDKKEGYASTAIGVYTHGEIHSALSVLNNLKKGHFRKGGIGSYAKKHDEQLGHRQQQQQQRRVKNSVTLRSPTPENCNRNERKSTGGGNMGFVDPETIEDEFPAVRHRDGATAKHERLPTSSVQQLKKKRGLSKTTVQRKSNLNAANKIGKPTYDASNTTTNSQSAHLSRENVAHDSVKGTVKSSDSLPVLVDIVGQEDAPAEYPILESYRDSFPSASGGREGELSGHYRQSLGLSSSVLTESLLKSIGVHQAPPSEKSVSRHALNVDHSSDRMVPEQFPALPSLSPTNAQTYNSTSNFDYHHVNTTPEKDKIDFKMKRTLSQPGPQSRFNLSPPRKQDEDIEGEAEQLQAVGREASGAVATAFWQNELIDIIEKQMSSSMSALEGRNSGCSWVHPRERRSVFANKPTSDFQATFSSHHRQKQQFTNCGDVGSQFAEVDNMEQSFHGSQFEHLPSHLSQSVDVNTFQRRYSAHELEQPLAEQNCRDSNFQPQPKAHDHQLLPSDPHILNEYLFATVTPWNQLLPDGLSMTSTAVSGSPASVSSDSSTEVREPKVVGGFNDHVLITSLFSHYCNRQKSSSITGIILSGTCDMMLDREWGIKCPTFLHFSNSLGKSSGLSWQASFRFLRDFGLLDQFTTATEVKELHSHIILKKTDGGSDSVNETKRKSRTNTFRSKMKHALDIIMTSTKFVTACDMQYETSVSPGLLSVLVT